MKTHVKVCGITRAKDALLAAELGASAVGFIFWPKSPRFIEPARARAIVGLLPPMVTAVGVFVDQPIAYVRRVADTAGLGVVQLHGHESGAYCRSVGRRVIKALSIQSDMKMTVLKSLPASMTLLLDAHDPVLVGGTGQTIDWTVAAAVARRRRVILSGGLQPHNVALAIERVRPYGVDVSSGVEIRPGVKDARRMRAFFRAVRSTEFAPDVC